MRISKYSLGLILLLNALAFGQNEMISEEVLLKNDSIQLPGTLTYPKEGVPLLIWVHGSGEIDRNGNQLLRGITSNYIKQFRDRINKNGFAFYSFDKRTSNSKNVKFLAGTNFNDLVDDLDIAINYFKDSGRFSEIVLIGHSQGSLTAILAAKNVDKYISVAGASRSFDRVIVEQLRQNPNIHTDTLKAHFKELRETGSIKYVNPVLLSLFSPINLPFLKSYMQYDPVEEIKKLKIPILILNGTKDLQIKEKDAVSLHEANPNSQLMIIENMNHVLKIIEKDKDNLPSYYSADFPLSEELVEAITSFIKE